MSEIQIPSKDSSGSFMAYIAMPEKKPAPVVILIQEIFGVNEEMRKKCDRFAEMGFVALCPDLFWRMEPGIQLSDKTEEERARAFDFCDRFDVNKGVEDLRATEHTFKGHAECNGKVGALGYGLGGRLAYLMAAESHIDASIGYYAIGIDKSLNESGQIKKPLMLHIAGEDKFVSKEQQQAVKDRLQDNPLVTLHSYPGTNHAFARDDSEHYDQQAAGEADGRTVSFLKQYLDMDAT